MDQQINTHLQQNNCNKLNKAIQQFNSFLNFIENGEWKKALSKSNKSYNLKLYNLDKLTPNRIREMYFTIVEKFYKNEKSKQYWYENQLRVYVWILFAYFPLSRKTPDQFSYEQWNQFSTIFYEKSANLCQYQYHILKKFSNKSKKWKQNEDEMLLQILKSKEIKNKWNQIAKQFYLRSDKQYFRTPKQCRQRWNNYLDPSKSKQNWSREEDIKLINLIIQKGKKWALIAKLLQDGKRTEHMVKNRFNSLVSKYIKYGDILITPQTLNLQELAKWIQTRINIYELKLIDMKDQSNMISDKNQSAKIEKKKQSEETNETTRFVIQNKMEEVQLDNEYEYINFEQKQMVIFESPIMGTDCTGMLFSPYNHYNEIQNDFAFEKLMNNL